MLSAFQVKQVKVRSSNQTPRRIVKRDDTKNKEKNIKDKLKDFKKLMLIICLLLNFVLEKNRF